MEVSFTSVYCDFLSPYTSKVPFRARFFGVIWIKMSDLRGGEWSFKRHGSCKIFVEFHGSRSLVFCGYVRLGVSFSSREVVSPSLKAKKISKYLVVFFVNDVWTCQKLIISNTLNLKPRSRHWRTQNVLGTQKNASLGFSQSIALTIHHRSRKSKEPMNPVWLSEFHRLLWWTMNRSDLGSPILTPTTPKKVTVN